MRTVQRFQLNDTTTFEYNLQGRLRLATVDADGDGTGASPVTTQYEYDDSGIRISQQVGDGSKIIYVVDKNNPTGYAQVFEEGTDDNGDDKLGNNEIDKSYVIGQDVIAQAVAGATNAVLQYLMYDGHGSTRALLDEVAAIVQQAGGPQQLFAYDAYGNLVGPSDVFVQQINAALTSLLYSGEQTDVSTALQYLRARPYDTVTGTFLRLDPFAGNFEVPQSLHKYLYTHADPVNGVDPTGLFRSSIMRLLNGIFGVGFDSSLGLGSSLTNPVGFETLATGGHIQIEVSLAGQSGPPLAVILDGGDLRAGSLLIAQSLLTQIGYILTNDGFVRQWYQSNARALGALARANPLAADSARNALKVTARNVTSPVGNSIINYFSSVRAPTRGAGNPTGTNAAFNKWYGRARVAGPSLLVIGAGVSVYNIATANNAYRQASAETGAWTGAWSFGWVGAKAGAVGGTALCGPFCGLVGAIGGALFGAVGGGIAGSQAGENIYDFLNE